uniref:Uncharacterized protein n=1 Tax=Anguilla anguilla TaxID=7936 RepID=A0A0E9WA05_ANGAN
MMSFSHFEHLTLKKPLHGPAQCHRSHSRMGQL